MNRKKTINNHRILFVDDDEEILILISGWLKDEGYHVTTVSSAEQALNEISNNQPNLVISDIFMEGMNGMDLLNKIHNDNPLLPVIMLSGQAEIPDAVRATHLGCSAFLTKPVNKENLLSQVKHALDKSPVLDLQDSVSSGIVYKSKVMANLLELAAMVADTNVTILISGATGTGKEVIAKAIHNASSRHDKPFIAVNCGAIPEQLLESELFGHEKGAFTGANVRHQGLFLAANGGTVFLDEIGDMPLTLQVKLLRVLQDLEIRPVGSTRTYPVDIRIISATHRDLEEAIKQELFREDLYYRLKVVPIHMPTLAERKEDIPVLAEHFLEAHARLNNQKKKQFSPEAIDYLKSASWPGNIRQLNNVVDLCATLSKSNIISLNLARNALQENPGSIKSLREVKRECEQNYLESVLRITKGNVANAAKIADRNRTEFYKLIGQYGIDPKKYRD